MNNIPDIKNNFKINFFIYGSVSAAIIWILISIFSKETGVHIILPVFAVIYFTVVHWFIDISSCSEIWPILLCLLCSVRLYTLNGFTAGESDEDGDGFLETVTITDNSTGEFEQYIKEKDGSVRPLESEKLLELYQKIYEAGMLLQKALDDAMTEIQTEEKGP